VAEADAVRAGDEHAGGEAFVQPVDVALDSGHSRADVGAVGSGLAEYQLTLDLAQRVRLRLQAAHQSVRLTREDDLPLSVYTDPNARVLHMQQGPDGVLYFSDAGGIYKLVMS